MDMYAMKDYNGNIAEDTVCEYDDMFANIGGREVCRFAVLISEGYIPVRVVEIDGGGYADIKNDW